MGFERLRPRGRGRIENACGGITGRSLTFCYGLSGTATGSEASTWSGGAGLAALAFQCCSICILDVLLGGVGSWMASMASAGVLKLVPAIPGACGATFVRGGLRGRSWSDLWVVWAVWRRPRGVREEGLGRPGGGSGRVWGGPGGILGGSWAVLGAILNRVFEHPVLGSIFGSILACMKFRLGVQDDPKTEPKTIKNRSQNEVEI